MPVTQVLSRVVSPPARALGTRHLCQAEVGTERGKGRATVVGRVEILPGFRCYSRRSTAPRDRSGPAQWGTQGRAVPPSPTQRSPSSEPGPPQLRGPEPQLCPLRHETLPGFLHLSQSGEGSGVLLPR